MMCYLHLNLSYRLRVMIYTFFKKIFYKLYIDIKIKVGYTHSKYQRDITILSKFLKTSEIANILKMHQNAIAGKQKKPDNF